MNLQIIKSTEGKAEYVLLPIPIYHAMQKEITAYLKKADHQEYVLFKATDYVDNPIALARIESGLTQAELAKKMQVSQAYISKIEQQANITPKLLSNVKKALRGQT